MNILSEISITGVNGLKPLMMKSLIIAVSLASMSGVTYAKKRHEWTGLYGGVNAGVMFNAASIDANHPGLTRPDGTCDMSAYFRSFFPGVQIGYSRQFKSRLVLGVEADFTYNFNKFGKESCVCPPYVSDQFVVKNREQGSLRGRIGYALKNHMLPYFMAGGSIANLGMNYRNEVGNYYNTNSTQPGWLAGVGIEWHFTPAWSVRAEYFYTFYNNAASMGMPVIYGLNDPNGHASFDLNANNFRAALNYWF